MSTFGPDATMGLFDDSESDLLFCQQERLDQNSPELWPEQIPGVTEFTSSALFSSPVKAVFDSVSNIVHSEKAVVNNFISCLLEKHVVFTSYTLKRRKKHSISMTKTINKCSLFFLIVVYKFFIVHYLLR